MVSCSQASGVTVEFRLDGGLVAGLRRKVHKCESRVRVELAPGLFSPTGKETPVCTSWITTHYGTFQDPCSQQGHYTVFRVLYTCMFA